MQFIKFLSVNVFHINRLMGCHRIANACRCRCESSSTCCCRCHRCRFHLSSNTIFMRYQWFCSRCFFSCCWYHHQRWQRCMRQHGICRKKGLRQRPNVVYLYVYVKLLDADDERWTTDIYYYLYFSQLSIPLLLCGGTSKYCICEIAEYMRWVFSSS